MAMQDATRTAQIIEFPSQPSRAELWAELMLLGQRMGHERSEEERKQWLEFCRQNGIGSTKTVAELSEMIRDKRDELREYAKGVLNEVGWD